MSNIQIFTSNITGAILMDKLDSFNCYPQIITYAPDVRKTALSRDYKDYENRFPILYIKDNNYKAVKEIVPLKNRVSICIDWTKDFFIGFEDEGDIIFSHPSLLPLYRGYSAITEQFHRGVCISGASFYKASGKVDSGDILRQAEFSVTFDDYPIDFLDKYCTAASEFIMDMKERGIVDFSPEPQDEELGFYLVRKRKKDAIIDFRCDAFSIYNHIRGYSKPFFGAYFPFKDQRFTVWRAKCEKWQGIYGEPGEVIDKDLYGIEVACGSGSIILTELEKNGEIYKDMAIPFQLGDNILKQSKSSE